MAGLMIATGEQAETYYQLASRPITGGRDPAREIQILDPKVSRKHFQIRKQGDHHTIIEFKSLNGVAINGSKIDGETRLNDGDEILVGDTLLVYYTDDNPDRSNALNRFRVASRQAREDRTVVD